MGPELEGEGPAAADFDKLAQDAYNKQAREKGWKRRFDDLSPSTRLKYYYQAQKDYTKQTGKPFSHSIAVEFRDYRIDSFQLREYIEDKMKETEDKYMYEYGQFFQYPIPFFRILTNIAFGTDFELFPEKLESKTVEHTNIGTVLIECLTYDEPYEDEEEGIVY